MAHHRLLQADNKHDPSSVFYQYRADFVQIGMKYQCPNCECQTRDTDAMHVHLRKECKKTPPLEPFQDKLVYQIRDLDSEYERIFGTGMENRYYRVQSY